MSKQNKSLFLIESPGKLKKISSYLGSQYIIKASYGHIMDLDKSCLSVDIENNFTPSYVINPDKKNIVKDLIKTAKECDEIIIAADGDREGNFISDSLKTVLNLKKYKRVIFHEITKKAILTAIENYTQIDYKQVHAQQCRRILDRLCGYLVSPLLKFMENLGLDINIKKLSMGRVQSVITKIIVNREIEIEKFLNSSKSSFYESKGCFKLTSDKEFNLNTVLYNTKPHKKFELIKESDDTFEQVLDIMNKLKDCEWKIIDIKKKTSIRNPTSPFITSTLQRESSTKLHWSIKKTMEVAQKLYEDGKITYMRSDSTFMSESAHANIKDYVNENFGKEYYSYKQYKTKSETSQEGHESIRVIDCSVLFVEDNPDKDKLYKLIWKKTISSQMSPAKIESTQITLAPYLNNKLIKDYVMIGSISRIVFDGYLRLYRDLEDEENLLEVKIDENADISVEPIFIKMKESLTSPPSRYNESSLVETLEKNSIARPSTYATMISKVQEKDYVRQQNVEGIEKSLKEIIYEKESDKLSIKDVKMFLGKENNRLVPTNLGKKITDFLNINFPQLMDIKFTANLEQDLDEISNGKKDWIDVLRAFYEILDSQIKNFLKTASPQTKNLKSCTNNELIGLHPETNQNIIYTKTKYGFALKMFNQEENKDIWISVKTKPKLEDAIELFKKKEEAPETKSTLIKKVNKYEIKEGPYGPYIQVKVGKSIKFFKIYGTKKPDELTLEDCKKLCIKKDYKKKEENKIDDKKVENKIDDKKVKVNNKIDNKVSKKVSKKV